VTKCIELTSHKKVNKTTTTENKGKKHAYVDLQWGWDEQL